MILFMVIIEKSALKTTKGHMGKMKRFIVVVVILAVIVVMALRGCPRVRRSASIPHNPATAGVAGFFMLKSLVAACR